MPLGNSILRSFTSGTWTPVLAGADVAGTQTYSTQDGFWRRNGDLCYISFRFSLSAFDAATAGDLLIRGLPFTSQAIASEQGITIAAWGDFTLFGGYTQMTLRVAGNDTSIELRQSGSAQARDSMDETTLSNTSNVSGGGVYRIGL